MKNIAFLIGSGVSTAVGMPSTNQISGFLLNDNNVRRYTTWDYYISHSSSADEYVRKIQNCMHLLLELISEYYKKLPVKTFNYEDIYFISQQISDSLTGNLDNPIVLPFMEKIKDDVETILPFEDPLISGRWSLQVLAEETTDYIKSVVWELLSNDIEDLSNLNVFLEANNDQDVYHVDIYTLNHDTVLEDYFQSKRIEFIDGFRNPNNGLRVWNPKLYQNNDSKIRIFKLHGSINWFPAWPNSNETWNQTTVLRIKNSKASWDNKELEIIKRRLPSILCGTYNKMLAYTAGIFSDLFHLLYTNIRLNNTLIISGYGFGDTGINIQIIDWLSSSPEKKLS